MLRLFSLCLTYTDLRSSPWIFIKKEERASLLFNLKEVATLVGMAVCLGEFIFFRRNFFFILLTIFISDHVRAIFQTLATFGYLNDVA